MASWRSTTVEGIAAGVAAGSGSDGGSTAGVDSLRRRMRAVTGSSAAMRRGAVRSGAASMVWAAFRDLIRSASSETGGVRGCPALLRRRASPATGRP